MLRLCSVVIVVCACAASETRVHLDVVADSDWGIDMYQVGYELRIGERWRRRGHSHICVSGRDEMAPVEVHTASSSLTALVNGAASIGRSFVKARAR